LASPYGTQICPEKFHVARHLRRIDAANTTAGYLRTSLGI
jgi:hypothetical protein